jgi:ferritin
MRMPEDLEAAFNQQVTLELTSATAYLQMAAFFANENLVGMSHWMRVQSGEELTHADRFFDFIIDRGNTVHLGDLPAPRSDFGGPEEAFEASLEQEQSVTKAIHSLYRLATDQGDLASVPFLQTFIAEQNEEESMVQTILDRLRLAGGDSGAIFLLDHELGARGAGAEE